MTCRSIRTLLPLAAGGDLKGARLDRVRAHLARCARCRSQFQSLEAGLSVLAEVRDLSPPPGCDLWERVGPRLSASRFAPGWWRTGLSWRQLSAACAMVLAVAFGIAVMPRDATDSRAPVAAVGASASDRAPRASDTRSSLPPVFVLDQAAPTWRHDQPDSLVRPHVPIQRQRRPVYVLEQGRAVRTPPHGEEF